MYVCTNNYQIPECFINLSSAYSSFSAPSTTPGTTTTTPSTTTTTTVISTTPATTDISTTAITNDVTSTTVTATQPSNSPNPRMMADDETGNSVDTLVT